MNTWQHVWLFFGWCFFGFLHSLLATAPLKEKLGRIMKGHYRYYRLYYSIVAVCTASVLVYFTFSDNTTLLWSAPVYQKSIALVAGMAGLAVVVICVKKYFFYLSGIDVFFRSSATEILKTDGMNRFVRHPLYTGTLLFVWSIFLWLPQLSYLITAISISVYTVIGAGFEEKKLIKIFGEAYKTYTRQVPMFIPKLRK